MDKKIKYFEVCFSSGYSMIIKALREPTLDEAAAFVAEDMQKLRESEVILVEEWTRKDAEGAFDFSGESDWPIFQ